MTYAIKTAGKFTNAAAPTVRDLTDLEKALAQCPNLDLWCEPTNIAGGKAGLWLRDLKNGQTLERVGTQKLSASGLNSNPSFDFNANGYFLLTGYQIPPSFTILTALTYNTGSNFQLVFGSPTDDNQRVYFGLGTSSGLKPWLDVDAGLGVNRVLGATLTNGTDHVIWGSFDDSDYAMRLGVDNVTPAYSSTGNTSHNGDTSSCLGGFTDSTTYHFKDDLGPVLVFNAPLHTSGYEDQLEAALAYLADYSGVTVTGL